ncbi:MAG: hypothetical protein A2W00_01615 [Candidatus Eisenbacteria bacterium RBG_16_71_46]|nr:MAG: hypothetical protein A2W00_01615 [Candidatus Eisenbacteria bacterium RBG_16_71_46]OGF23870.1 MAG: hypothetical protein A2V63_08775 [Candidatus Eisenbacteria bacterium RBG_19FT_COMBO_70_11]
MLRGKRLVVLLALALVAAVAVQAALRLRPGDATAAATGALSFGDNFWRLWGDGRAELAGYDLEFPRYGRPRKGTAVTIFVTETFSNSLRVKADPGKHPASDEFPVMKLNLVQDFPTGIYDYNLMTSAFVALRPVNGRPAGSATKVSFSAQEWCGQVYSQILFDHAVARLVSHSYFDGEADREERLQIPDGALAEDALLLWARGFAAPALAPGESRQVDLVRSLRFARLQHQPLSVTKATLTRRKAAGRITVPAGTFDAEVRTVAISGGPTWTFDVEAAAPHRILRWASSEGQQAQLLASDRLKYWEMNAPRYVSELAKLGLQPRRARMP